MATLLMPAKPELKPCSPRETETGSMEVDAVNYVHLFILVHLNCPHLGPGGAKMDGDPAPALPGYTKDKSPR